MSDCQIDLFMPKPGTCKRCGRVLSQSKRGRPRTWCSWACKRPAPSRECRWCKKAIIGEGERKPGRRAIYCSKECRVRGRNQELRKQSREDRRCSFCRSIFRDAARRAHCSDECRQKGGAFSEKISRMLRSARSRARVKGLPFTISKQWLIQRVKRGTCEVTGLPFELLNEGDSNKNPWGPSIDRMDSGKGYTTENAQVVVWIYNRAKGEHDAADVLRMAAALAERFDTT